MQGLKGLEVSKQFFEDWGLPFLQRHYPEYVDRIAAGRMLGSDVLGGDDQISQDHNWGPQFFLFLTESDYRAVGEQISKAMNAGVPVPWRGYSLARQRDQNVIVVSVPMFFERMLDMSRPPTEIGDWPSATVDRESDLYFIRHGAIFQDPLGELSLWREALHFYPHPLWMRRLAEECHIVWHRGEYNFVQRMADRHDPLMNDICLGGFTEAVMRLFLLASGDYTPYWKWLPQEFRKLPTTTQVAPLLTRLVISRDKPEQRELVQEICTLAHRQLLDTGLITGKIINPNSLPLENARHELRAQSKLL